MIKHLILPKIQKIMHIDVVVLHKKSAAAVHENKPPILENKSNTATHTGTEINSKNQQLAK